MTERLVRRQRLTGKQIAAAEAGVAAATLSSRVLRRLMGLNKLCALGARADSPVPRASRIRANSHPCRYQEKLVAGSAPSATRIGSPGRQTGVVNRHLGIGWEFVHICIDDASRIAFSRVMRDERKASRRQAFLEAAVAFNTQAWASRSSGS